MNAKAKIISAVLALAIVFTHSAVPISALWEDYPDGQGHWAEATLKRAVDDGILQGSGNSLNPDGNITLAQVVTIINRVLKTDVTSETTLSGPYEADWYWDDMLKAQALGLISPSSKSEMTAPITRSAVFSIFGEAFQLNAAETDYSSLKGFTDSGLLTGAAKDAAAAMAGKGILTGANGYLNPGSYITRAEFVTLLYRILDTYSIYDCTARSVSVSSSEKAALVRSSSISGLYINGSVPELCIASLSGNVSVSPYASVPLVKIGAGSGNVSVSGSVKNVEITGGGRNITISGYSVKSVKISGSGNTVSIASGLSLDELKITGGNNTVILNGKTALLSVSGSENEISGSGSVQEASINTARCSVALKSGYGASKLDGTEVILSAPDKVPAGGSLTVTASFETNLSDTAVAAQWYKNGEALYGYSNSEFIISADASSSYTPEIIFTEDMDEEITVGLSLTYSTNGEFRYIYKEITVPIENYSQQYYLKPEIDRVQKLVKTYEYPATIRTSCSLYKSGDLSGWIQTLDRGTTGTCIYRNGFYSMKIRLSNGVTGWVKYSNVSLGTGNYTRSEDYTASDKELWVNSMGYSSSTNYLVWVNLGCQKVNVFQGSEGNWELIKTFSCASGRSSTPSPMGTFKIIYKMDRWNFGSYYCGPVTGFYGEYAFHSWLHTPSGGQYDYTMGRPASHGCIRMEDEGAKYMYSLPFNTTVVVF